MGVGSEAAAAGSAAVCCTALAAGAGVEDSVLLRKITQSLLQISKIAKENFG